MEAILDWGINVVLWLQRFSPSLDAFFSFFTLLGEEMFFLLFLPFVYWALDRNVGALLALLFMLSSYLNNAVKELVAQPRPFEYDLRVQKLFEVDGYAFPSGHTQSALVVWGYLASQLRRRWATVVAVVLIIFIPLSRVYLGLHFPTDLLGGYLAGGVILLLFLLLSPRLTPRLGEWSIGGQLLLAAGVPALLFFSPYLNEDAVSVTATLLGMGLGFILERRSLHFSPAGSVGKRLLRFGLGALVLVGLWGGLRAAFAGLEPAFVLRAVRYVVLGFWVAAGAPWLFLRLGLAEREADSPLPVLSFPAADEEGRSVVPGRRS